MAQSSASPKYKAKGHSLGVGINGHARHARSRYIQQDDAAFYRITSISCFIDMLLIFMINKVFPRFSLEDGQEVTAVFLKISEDGLNSSPWPHRPVSGVQQTTETALFTCVAHR